MLTLRLIDPDDYTVHDDGQLIGRIRYTGEHAAGLWLWTIIVPIPGASSGDAKTLDEAKARFKSVWVAFKGKRRSAPTFSRHMG
ncbi:hypothetical protein BSZ21_03490 [Bradyrhizobium canariense]|uniref:hypothetical protein n=1 Tax=Bradyrhizobium canariense TaxID=255045 RepID=UPI000A195941|nr:hypothetical protein [Bradyrhizobium canariense]OSI76960.1 hypothetical protein BSZ21_03490 [Bradyrhizobium canariense]